MSSNKNTILKINRERIVYVAAASAHRHFYFLMLPVNSWTPIIRFCSVRNIGFLRHRLHYASDCYYFYYDYESRSEEHLGVIRGKAFQDARNGVMSIWLFSLTHDACCLSLILHILIKIIVFFLLDYANLTQQQRLSWEELILFSLQWS